MNRFTRMTSVVLFLGASPALAQSVLPPSSAAPGRLLTPPVIDGRLDDEVWADATRLTQFHQIQPGDNLEPSQQTEVRIGYDQRAFYIAFRAFDTSGKVRATIARRDALDEDDVVGIYLDTFRDRRRAYYIFFNPFGVQADGIYVEGATTPDLTVDLVIDSKGTVDTNGYTVEAAIPFASLRYQPGESPVWGLHVQRFIRRDRNEQISWMPISRSRSSLLDQAGTLGPFVDVGEGRPLEIIPTGVATSDRDGSRASDSNLDPGVTVNFGITPTLNAAFTANPDFAQVESDALVLTVNQRFPIFYDEKRPFFLEGNDAFQTPINLIHTRTIVSPDYAGKLTGKRGKTTVGALFAEDDGRKGAFRVKRDVRRDSTIGAAATVIDAPGTSNRVISADARIRFTDQTVLTGQLATSSTDRRGDGLAYHGRIERRTRRTMIALTSNGVSPSYRADLGFTRRVNMNSMALQTTYNSEPRADATLLSWTLTHVGLVQWDWQGRMDFAYVYPQAQLNFRKQTYVRVLSFRDYERLFEEEFGGARTGERQGAFIGDSERSTSWEGFVLQAGSSPSEALAFSGNIARSWDVYDYDFGAGRKFPRVSPAALIDPSAPLDPGPSTSTSFGGDVTWRPRDALRTSLDLSRNTLVRNDNGRTAYDAWLLSWRTTHQFTRFVALRLRTDWDSATTTLRGQYLFAWTPHPGTAIFAGYNDVASIDGFDDEGRMVPGYRRSGRTLFVKLSYLLRRVL